MGSGHQPAGRGRGSGRAIPGATDAGGARTYSEEDRQNSLELLRDNISQVQVARVLDIPRGTIRRWAAQPDLVLGRGYTPTLYDMSGRRTCSVFILILCQMHVYL